jgi:two-component system, OmpR family, response regulator ResD
MAMTEVQTPPARVLIIEDDTTTLQFFEQMLVEQGYIVRAVSTVEAGITEAGAHRPDAVVLDLHLPVTDGLECLRRLRAVAQTRIMPVAILTGDYFMDDDVARELQELGAKIHFKPVWEDDLHRIVQGLVTRSDRRH